MSVRPISALRPTILGMADAAQRANIEVVRKATGSLHKVVVVNGAQFTLRGRGGRQVPLTAAMAVKAVGNEPVGSVRAIPEGFWKIVEYGSGPHLIYSRRQRSSNRQAGRATTFRRFAEGDSLGHLRPVRTPYGPRQFVNHPGHRTIGTPWESSMRAGGPIVLDTLRTEQTRALVRQFT